MERTSPNERYDRDGHGQNVREHRGRRRSPSASVSPPARPRKTIERRERRDERYKDKDDRDSKRPYDHGSTRSSRSRSPGRPRRRSRSNSSNEERSRRHRRSADEGRHDRKPRKRDRHEDHPRDRERERPSHRTHRERSRSEERERSPPRHPRRGTNVTERFDERPPMKSGGGRDQNPEEAPPSVEKEMPNYGRSGKLAAETNRVEGTKIALKYHEPPEARLPPAKNDWRMYEFKGKETISTTELSKRSCWLIGREEAVVDFPVAHPSCSSQHAVLQFRFVDKKNEYGERIGKVKLYVLDLESSNGTSLNGERIEERRFIEVRHGDVVRFGDSTREYVFLLA